jgi:hypothetical protein
MKTCRMCGGGKVKFKDYQHDDGWSGRLYCKKCGHSVSTVICATLASAQVLTYRFWELDN